MKRILLLGAGRSSNVLIEYLLGNSENHDWNLTIGDVDINSAESKLAGNKNGTAITLDVNDKGQLLNEVQNSDLVISMLPALFHQVVAEACVGSGVSLITASYVTDEMKSLDGEARRKGIILLNECGVDPGIDHMSAMKVMDRIRNEGGVLKGFETFTGGLLAPDAEDNPWNYKFTWNPRNVVLAGQGGVKFIQEGRYKYIPYHRLFRRTEIVHILKYGYFEGYANRDSLRYREVYGLEEIPTMYRGTLRRQGFCKAWNVFVQLGATDDSYELEEVQKMTHRQFINLFLPYNPHDSVELKLAHYMNLDFDSEEMHKMKWLNVFDDDLVGLDTGTPAQVLEHILKKKWTMEDKDRDMIVMWHKFSYDKGGEEREMNATLVALGDGSGKTAMSRTVGLPMGICAKLILTGQLSLTGVRIPIEKEIYHPTLQELVEDFHFDFTENKVEVDQ